MLLHSPTQWRKREVCPISCFFVWTAFKHQVLEDFSPGRYDDDEMKHTPTEKLQNQSIRGQIIFAIQLQAFQ